MLLFRLENCYESEIMSTDNRNGSEIMGTENRYESEIMSTENQNESENPRTLDPLIKRTVMNEKIKEIHLLYTTKRI